MAIIYKKLWKLLIVPLKGIGARGFTGGGIGDIGDSPNVPNVTNDDTNPEYPYATYRSGTIVVTIESDTITLSPPLSERITSENDKEAA